MIEEKLWSLKITMKSGATCTHELTSTEDAFWAMVTELAPLIGNDQATGAYACGGPYAIHRISEMESIHYGDYELPANVPVGFVGR